MRPEQKNKMRTPFLWENVHFVGKITLDWERPMVYRYMPYSRVQEMLKNDVITFVSPALWDDPYEKRYYNAKLNGDKNVFPNIACLCVTSSPSENSAAFWNWSKGSNESWLRIGFSLFELLEGLNGIVKNRGARIYVSSMQYDYDENEINNIYKKMNFTPENLERSYVNLLSIKRKAYRYENELRISVVWNRNTAVSESIKNVKYEIDKTLKISFSKSFTKALIKKITLDPRQGALAKEGLAFDLNLIKRGEITKYKKELKSVIKKYEPTIEIQKSQLFHAYKCKNIDYTPKKRNQKK